MQNRNHSRQQQKLLASNSSAPEDRIANDKNLVDEIQKLARNVQTACEKNRTNYNKIIKNNPLFSHQIYNPPVHLSTKKCEINQTKNLLIKQLDNLLEEQNKFLRELNKIQIREEQQRFFKESRLEKQMNHFLFLRNVWKRSTVAVDSQDRVQKLNKSVALIKGHITAITKRQNSDSISNQAQSQKQFIINSWQYTQLKEKYQKLLMEVEQGRQIKEAKEKESVNQQVLRKLKQENQNLMIQLSAQKQKVRKLQKAKLNHIIKVQDLEEQIFKKERDLHKLNKEIKLVYKNELEDFRVHIITKNLTSKEQKTIEKTLQEVMADLEELKLNIKIKSQESENNQQNEKDQQLKNKKFALTGRDSDFYQRKHRNSQQCPNLNPLIGLIYQKDAPQISKISNCVRQAGPNTKRLRSISDKNTNLQTDLKKARFIRTATKNSLDDPPKQQNKEQMRGCSNGQKIKFENQSKRKDSKFQGF